MVADALVDVQGLAVAAAGLVVLGLGAGAIGQTQKGVGFALLGADALGDVQGLVEAEAGLVVLGLGAGAMGQIQKGVGHNPVVAPLLSPPEVEMDGKTGRWLLGVAILLVWLFRQPKPIFQPLGQCHLQRLVWRSLGHLAQPLLGQFAVALAPGQVGVVEGEPGRRARRQFALFGRRDQPLRGGPISCGQGGFDGCAHLLPDSVRLHL